MRCRGLIQRSCKKLFQKFLDQTPLFFLFICHFNFAETPATFIPSTNVRNEVFTINIEHTENVKSKNG